MRNVVIIATAFAMSSGSGAAYGAEPTRTVPYYASINAGRARMRTGPARTYPVSWLYQRAGLPIRVIAVFKEWRKIEDPDGTQGWMQANLLTQNRSAIVKSPLPVEMREHPDTSSKLMWRAAPGVVGRISQCGNSWCRLDVKGQAGFVDMGGLWGVAPGEVLP